MPKYAVTIQETISYQVIVEADDKKEARETATELLLQSENPFEDFGGSVDDRDVTDVSDITHQFKEA